MSATSIRSFEDLKVWQKAHSATLEIYKATKHFPDSERFGLTSQMRRAAVSGASNIVEGFRRHSFGQTINFYNIAAGSLDELRYQLVLSRDLGYIDSIKYGRLNELLIEISKMLSSWIAWNKKKAALKL
jgi:four helix bundle protein